MAQLAALPSDPFRRALRLKEDFAAGLRNAGRTAEEAETVHDLQNSVRRFAADHIDSAAIDHEKKIPPRLLAEAANLGLFGLTIPEEYGGAGLSLQATCGVMEELAYHDRSVATSIGLHNGLGLRGLIRHGSEDLKRRYLPALAAGQKIAAFAATEPNAGSDLANIRATALPDPQDPAGLLLNGDKCYITNAGFASLFTLVMYTPGLGGKKRGHSMILAPREIPGFTLGREEDKLGLRGSSTTSLYFDNAPVPADHLIGEPGRGIELMHRVLAWGRTLMAAGCVGTANYSLTMAARQVISRRQFGRTLSEFELVRRQIAEMRAGLYFAQSVARAAARTNDQLNEGAAWETAAAKILCSEYCSAATDMALQLHGGSGFIEETGVARPVRDCRVTRIFEGANDVLRLHLATEMLTWPLRELTEAEALVSFVPPALREAAAGCAADLTELVDVILGLRREYGIKAVERQALLANLAGLALPLYGMFATLLRTAGTIQEHGGNAPEIDLALLSCQLAHETFTLARGRLKNHATALHDRIARAEFERPDL